MSTLSIRKFDSQGKVKVPGSAIFVEKDGELFRCYKLSWLVEGDGIQPIYRERHYGCGSFVAAVGKAESIISWHKKMREEKQDEEKKMHRRYYLSWKKHKSNMMARRPREREKWFKEYKECGYWWATLFGKENKVGDGVK